MTDFVLLFGLLVVPPLPLLLFGEEVDFDAVVAVAVVVFDSPPGPSSPGSGAKFIRRLPFIQLLGLPGAVEKKIDFRFNSVPNTFFKWLPDNAKR